MAFLKYARLLVLLSLLTVSIDLSAAIKFNGTNSYATMENQSFLNGATVTNFSFDFWIKNDRPGINQSLSQKCEYWKEWVIGFPPDGAIYFMHAWPNTYYGMVSTNGVIKPSQWHHVAITGEGGTGTIYVDGMLVHQEAGLRGEISFNASISGSAIAGMVWGLRDNYTVPDGDWFEGELAHYRVWDTALTPTQVASLYLVAAATNSIGLRHWFPLTENSGNTFHDIIGGIIGETFNVTWSADPQPSFCSPHRATATATVVNGFVVGATIDDPGCGYTNAPTVLIQGGGGTGATAVAVVSDGMVVAVNIVSAGSGYTSTPKILIGSPPFEPTVSIAVSKVKVTQHVVLGRTYQLESSLDLATWSPAGAPYTAASETVVAEFDVDQTGRYFRIRQIP